jgi:hypothetical protein
MKVSNNITLILSLLISLLIASCATKRFSETITIKDTVIIPAKIQLDTLVLFKDSIVTIHDTTNQMTITIQKFRDKYIRVQGICKPKEIIIPITKTITKTKQVIVENSFYKYSFFLLLLCVGTLLLFQRFK